MASLTMDAIEKFYGAQKVIHGISLDIPDGEFVTLVGPSGCGKSTLLRMIAGLETISGGDIRIGSDVVNNLAPKDRDIAMVFQSYALYPHRTVEQNMGYALKLKGWSKADIRAEVMKAAEILDLVPLLDRRPSQLSGGQRQRVAMGRAIVRDPRLFLFDEPLSNLDAKLRVAMRAEIKELHQRLGTTTVYVTHDQIEAMTMADRIVVMNKGIVEQVGRPLDLYDRPANLFVAGFLGSPAMNLLQGRMADGAIFTGENGMEIPLGEVPARAGEAMTLGLRPEHLSVVGADVPGSIPVRVSVTEPTGSDTMISARVGQSELVILHKDRLDVRPGDTLHVAPRPGHAHIFANDDGRRLN